MTHVFKPYLWRCIFPNLPSVRPGLGLLTRTALLYCVLYIEIARNPESLPQDARPSEPQLWGSSGILMLILLPGDPEPMRWPVRRVRSVRISPTVRFEHGGSRSLDRGVLWLLLCALGAAWSMVIGDNGDQPYLLYTVILTMPVAVRKFGWSIRE